MVAPESVLPYLNHTDENSKHKRRVAFGQSSSVLDSIFPRLLSRSTPQMQTLSQTFAFRKRAATIYTIGPLKSTLIALLFIPLLRKPLNQGIHSAQVLPILADDNSLISTLIHTM